MSMKKKFIEEPGNRCVIAMMEKPYTVEDEVMRVNRKVAGVLGRMDVMFGKNQSSNPEYKSMAKCSGDDTFDGKTGREIAGQKSDYKYHKSMTKQYNRYINLLEDIISVLEQLRNRHIEKSLKIEGSLKKYL